MTEEIIKNIDKLVNKYPVQIVFNNVICDFKVAALGSKPDAERIPILQSNKNSNFKNATMLKRWQDNACYGQVTLYDLPDDFNLSYEFLIDFIKHKTWIKNEFDALSEELYIEELTNKGGCNIKWKKKDS